MPPIVAISSAGEVGTGWQTTRKRGRDGRYAALSSLGSSLRRLRRLVAWLAGAFNERLADLTSAKTSFCWVNLLTTWLREMMRWTAISCP